MKKVIIIGSGVAGLQAAITLSEQGVQPIIIEKEAVTGGKLNLWDRLFPTMTPAHEVLDKLREKIQDGIAEIRLNSHVVSIDNQGQGVTLATGEQIAADGVIVASGFDIFSAEIKEEYGYGIYKNVITSVDLEAAFKSGKPIRTVDGGIPRTIALLHCVGSRDEKVNQRHCSRVCCITGVKQAIELKEVLPEAEIYNFYMDMRVFGPGYEELYRHAQQDYNIHFVRGRISEASQTIDHRIQIKAEDTLIGRPLKMSVDLLILIVGMQASESNTTFAKCCSGIDLYPSDFIKPASQFIDNVCSGEARILYAGTATAPKNIGESINEGITAAYKMAQHLNSL